MKLYIKSVLCIIAFTLLVPLQNLEGQSKKTKKLKRPTSRVGIASVDSFVQESFDLYDKVYMYDGYAEAGTPLADEDLDVLEAALEDVTNLSSSAPNIISDLDGRSVLKQSKATLQINRAKKALKYSIKTAKKLLTEKRKKGDENDASEENDEGEENDESGEKTSKSISLEEDGENEVGFKRGNYILYEDDFSKDAVGDFPAKWNTTVGGEVKKLKGFDSKFLKVPANSIINLETTKPFPNNFTAEMDVIIPEAAPIRMAAIGFAVKMPKKLDYMITSEDDIRLMFYSRNDINADAFKFGSKSPGLGYTYIKVNYKVPLNQGIHVAFEINGRRMRIFVDGKKMVDLPTAYKPEFSNVFFLSALTHGDPKSLKNHFYISNVVIAETGEDVRSTVLKDLLEKGNFTTNDIHFTSGSDELQPSSNDILNQIGEAMQNNPTIKFKIIGHTDSDGDNSFNQILSEKRAESVKTYLISNFNIFAKNLVAEGKGESNPVVDNNSSDGKAQNRRVEFIKI